MRSAILKSELLTIVPKMSKRLVVNPQLELVPMLHYAQSVALDVPREQEGRVIPIS